MQILAVQKQKQQKSKFIAPTILHRYNNLTLTETPRSNRVINNDWYNNPSRHRDDNLKVMLMKKNIVTIQMLLQETFLLKTNTSGICHLH